MSTRMSNCVSLGVPDLEKAIAFYESALGFKVSERGEDYVGLDSGQIQLYLSQRDAPSPQFELMVPDREEARDRLSQIGFVEVPVEAGSIFMRDPYGYVFHLYEKDIPDAP